MKWRSLALLLFYLYIHVNINYYYSAQVLFNFTRVFYGFSRFLKNSLDFVVICVLSCLLQSLCVIHVKKCKSTDVIFRSPCYLLHDNKNREENVNREQTTLDDDEEQLNYTFYELRIQNPNRISMKHFPLSDSAST